MYNYTYIYILYKYIQILRSLFGAVPPAASLGYGQVYILYSYA